MRAVVWFGNVVLVDLDMTSRCPDDEINNFRHSLCLVFLESADPLRGDIVQTRPTRKYLSYGSVNARIIRVGLATSLTIQTVGVLLDKRALANGRLPRSRCLLPRACSRTNRKTGNLAIRFWLLLWRLFGGGRALRLSALFPALFHFFFVWATF
jgi:hypothetical protein